MTEELKTSEEWTDMVKKKLGVLFFICDPDGWDRINFHHSFNVEKISKEEYKNRLVMSTLIGSPLDLCEVLDKL